MMHHKALLLDVDGVVLKNPRVLYNVAQKITRYVRKVIPQRVSAMEADEINRCLYSTFGHTHRGLTHVYGPNVPTMAEFNAAIYDDEIMQQLWTYRNDNLMQARALEVHALTERAARLGMPVYLFSNAPTVWCAAVCEALDLQIQQDDMLGVDHPVFRNKFVKPDRQLYEGVDAYITHTHRYQAEPGHILFVDDSWTNIAPVVSTDGWTPVHLTDATGPRIVSKRVRTITSLKQLMPLMT